MQWVTPHQHPPPLPHHHASLFHSFLDGRTDNDRNVHILPLAGFEIFCVPFMNWRTGAKYRLWLSCVIVMEVFTLSCILNLIFFLSVCILCTNLTYFGAFVFCYSVLDINLTYLKGKIAIKWINMSYRVNCFKHCQTVQSHSLTSAIASPPHKMHKMSEGSAPLAFVKVWVNKLFLRN